MAEFESGDGMQDVRTVIRDPLRFKLKLDIGDQAFSSLRLKKYLLDSVDAANGAATGFVFAKSSLVASTFFAPTGFLGALGIGTAATPVGWAIGAGIAGAGLSLIIGKRFIRGSSEHVKQIPDFINTPMDVLATGLFDMIATLGVKLARIDGEFGPEERDFITSYFVEEWGYDPLFVQQGLTLIEEHSDRYSIKEISEQLARFKKANPDCNYRSMSQEILIFLNGIAEADGPLDEREEMAIERVEAIFEEVNAISTTLSESARAGVEQVSRYGKSTLNGLGSGLEGAKRRLHRLKTQSREKLSRLRSKKQ
ncbi:TerB family tellurite resistance protein [Marinobacter vulgaris]|uniref:TerB family tellurite resistance protein n=1 Tax=Marinobacter vulgaris TaxID=1928331 RepID=A0A2V3ZH25_9GAMM|nr:TerB family tellurite resistance protein [Marinobacter vulgaris]PXX89110.1 TerB family tellurite resistance protein [Marinobacter vulgaris]TSJ67448.1 TerB family tellurite resistance protein [Marinobacter vulgaris]